MTSRRDFITTSAGAATGAALVLAQNAPALAQAGGAGGADCRPVGHRPPPFRTCCRNAIINTIVSRPLFKPGLLSRIQKDSAARQMAP